MSQDDSIKSNGPSTGKWLSASDIQSKFIGFEYEASPGGLLVEVYVDETDMAVKIRFAIHSSPFSTRIENFMPGLHRAVDTLAADLKKGFSGSEP